MVHEAFWKNAFSPFLTHFWSQNGKTWEGPTGPSCTKQSTPLLQPLHPNIRHGVNVTATPLRVHLYSKFNR